MRALSLSQPWASIVVDGPKRVENRPPNIVPAARKLVGEVFGVHAARSIDRGAAATSAAAELGLHDTRRPAGFMLGTARLVAVLTIAELLAEVRAGRVAASQERWGFGPWCLMLDDVRALPAPVACRGHLGFWTVSAEIAPLLAELAGL